jgi:hypothetical protein
MPIFKCSICNFQTKYKFSFERHVSTKKHQELSLKSSKLSRKLISSKKCNTNATQPCNTNATQNCEDIVKDLELTSNYASEDEIYHSESELDIDNVKDLNLEEESEEELDSNISNNSDKLYQCEYCSREFKTHQSYYRHRNHYCRKNKIARRIRDKSKIDMYMKAMQKLEDLILEQQNQISLLTNNNQLVKQNNSNQNNSNNVSNNNINSNNKIDNTVNNINNINNIDNSINNNVNNNITLNLNNFGKEDTSHITQDFMFRLLKMPGDMVFHMIKAIHYNAEKPQNKNIKITNKKDKFIKVIQNGKWICRDKDDVLFDLIDEKYFMMDSFFNDMRKNHRELLDKKLNAREQHNYLKFSATYDAECERGNKKKGMVGGMIKRCFFMLINEGEF